MPPPPPHPGPLKLLKNMHFGPDMKDWFSIVFPSVYYIFTVMRSAFADILVSPVPMDFMYRPAGPPKIKTEKCGFFHIFYFNSKGYYQIASLFDM